jgi:hypothetical protein
MSRNHANVEFLHFLSKEVLELDGAAFAKKLGKHPGNVTHALNGAVVPEKLFFRKALRHAFEWEVRALFEVEPITHATSLPTSAGIHCLYDSAGSVIYVGQASNLKQEVGQALQRKMNFPVRTGPKLGVKARPKFKSVTRFLSAYEVNSPRLRHNLEALLLRTFPNQSHNNKVGNFK